MSRCIAAIAIPVLAVAVAAQPPQLKIVVLEGENAVNIIQQKTAVRALVEVRDQNNLPVSGASVTFAVTGKGGATVAGAQTVTVATNTAGQAALSGMTPASSGGLQISVNASFNGLTASATITQTVVATAVAAAAAAGVATTAAAAGGGLSTGAIVGIVGGVAAVGGGVAVAGGGGSENDRSSSAPPPPPIPTPVLATPCRFTVSPTVLTVRIEGGTFPVSISVGPDGCSNGTWLVNVGIASNFVSVDRTSGTGNGAVNVTVAPFTPTQNFPSRSGAIGVADTVVQILQPRALSLLRRQDASTSAAASRGISSS
jgi:hypothetical protein